MPLADGYIEEFNPEAIRHYGLGDGPWVVVRQGLEEGEGADDGVRFFVVLKNQKTNEEREVLIPDSCILHLKLDSPDDIRERTADILDIDPAAVDARLKKVGL